MSKQNDFETGADDLKQDGNGLGGRSVKFTPRGSEPGTAPSSEGAAQKDATTPLHKKGGATTGRKIKKLCLWVVAVIASLALLLGGTLFVMIKVGKASLLDNESMKLEVGSKVSDVQVEQDGTTLDYGGKRYVYNENMTTVLCMGVDEESFSDIEGVTGLNGQADAVFLYALDTETGDSVIIPIPRDTMVEVDLYSPSGRYVSSAQRQLCLAYAYGDGGHKSCENTLKSVSRLFYGLQINSYVAIDLKALEILSASVGGVPVTPTDTFSYGGYTFYKGQRVNLKGQRARAFVQGRDESRLDSSLTRMSHQKQFITSFFDKAIAKTREDLTFPVTAYSSASKYMVTDVNISEISFLATCALKGGSLRYASIDGQMVMGEEYAEFEADPESVYQTILDVFYIPAE